jgi:hypothetical protein
MPAKSVKSTLSYIQQAIRDCWEAQANLDDDDDEFKSLDSQIKAYQDLHTYLTDEEYVDGSDDVAITDEPTQEPEEVLEANEDSEEEPDEDEPAEDE